MDVTPTTETARVPALVSEPSPRKVPDYALLARLVVRESKTFMYAAIEAGYSESVARRGLRQLIAESNGVSEAFRQEYERINADITKLKPIAVARLYREIAAPDSPNGMKAIELAGRFKETDWFVRNVDVQLGVFLGLTESTPSTDVKTLDEFKE